MMRTRMMKTGKGTYTIRPEVFLWRWEGWWKGLASMLERRYPYQVSALARGLRFGLPPTTDL